MQLRVIFDHLIFDGHLRFSSRDWGEAGREARSSHMRMLETRLKRQNRTCCITTRICIKTHITNTTSKALYGTDLCIDSLYFTHSWSFKTYKAWIYQKSGTYYLLITKTVWKMSKIWSRMYHYLFFAFFLSLKAHTLFFFLCINILQNLSMAFYRFGTIKVRKWWPFRSLWSVIFL